MCTVSFVHDHFQKQLEPYIQKQWQGFSSDSLGLTKKEIDEFRALVKEFRELMAAAERIDIVTKQPDCVDPEKAKLQDRVKKLEKVIADVQGRVAEASKPAGPLGLLGLTTE